MSLPICPGGRIGWQKRLCVSLLSIEVNSPINYEPWVIGVHFFYTQYFKKNFIRIKSNRGILPIISGRYLDEDLHMTS